MCPSHALSPRCKHSYARSRPLTSMKRIHTDIRIEANAANVWRTLIDFGRYSEWNPTMPQVTAAAASGSHVHLCFRTSKRVFQLVAHILVAHPGQELRWTGPNSKLGRIVFRGEHYWLLESAGPNTTQLRHGEVFNGLLVPLMARWLDREVAPAFVAFNAALKQRVEGVAARVP